MEPADCPSCGQTDIVRVRRVIKNGELMSARVVCECGCHTGSCATAALAIQEWNAIRRGKVVTFPVRQ